MSGSGTSFISETEAVNLQRVADAVMALAKQKGAPIPEALDVLAQKILPDLIEAYKGGLENGVRRSRVALALMINRVWADPHAEATVVERYAHALGELASAMRDRRSRSEFHLDQPVKDTRIDEIAAQFITRGERAAQDYLRGHGFR